ncbi:MAG TPA: NAD(P)/FAD-dependent oxidoreductase [Trueperaceae bacterium]|nr:NAD(P)/FAD-dependent oxidoreductase [Trueperaceae bacterium]
MIIVGAGFAGLYAAKALKHAPVDVLLIDAHNYHTFQPLLYQVATAALDAGDIAHQVRNVFKRQPNVRFRMGLVTGVDEDAKEVVLEGGERLGYDYLILANGAVYNDFGTPGVREHAFVLKDLDKAVKLRGHILSRFERAAVDPRLIDAGALTFVIVGAGPTGVEMAGALVELFQRVLPPEYPELDLRVARVVLIEMGPEVLPPFGQASRRYAERVLRQRGVDVRLRSAVVNVTEDGVTLKSGEFIPCQTVIWAAGVRGHPLGEDLGMALERGFRVPVEPDLSLPGRPEVFVVGDLAGAKDAADRLLPQVAQVAIQAGKHAARSIVKRIQGRQTEPFVYRDLGNMAIIGRSAGIAELSRLFLGLRLRGFVGWLGWLFLHLVYLPGFRNRLSAVVSWAYNFITYDRHARLILRMGPGRGFSAPRGEAAPDAAPREAGDAEPSAAPPEASPGDEGPAEPVEQGVTVERPERVPVVAGRDA